MRISIKVFLLLSIINHAWAKVEIEPDWDMLTTEKAYELLQAGQYDPKKISNGGDSCLHNAVKKQDLSAVKLALFIGFDPSIANKAGDTALHIAATKGNLQIVELLVEQSAPLHWPNKLGDTPLHNAAAYGNLPMVSYLLKQGAPLALLNALEQSPYHKALAAQNSDVAAFLVAEGYIPGDPDVDLLTAQGYCPSLDKGELLIKAVERDDIPLVKKLITGIESPDWHLRLPLYTAVKRGNLQIVSLLLEHGAKVVPIYVASDHTTLVHEAAKSGKTAILALLLTDSDIQLNARDLTGGATALHYAVANGDLYAVKLLIERGANVNILSHSEWKRGSIPEDFWTSYDWEAWADADSALPHRFTERQEGWVHPIISPLTLAIERHPFNRALIEMLQSHGAQEHYEASSWDKKLRF